MDESDGLDGWTKNPRGGGRKADLLTLSGMVV